MFCLCLEAVKQNGYSLQYVKNQTPKICAKAIKQNPKARKYINIDMELVDNYILEKKLKKNNVDYDKMTDDNLSNDDLSTVTIEI